MHVWTSEEPEKHVRLLITHHCGFYLVCIPQWAIRQCPHQLQIYPCVFLESKPKQHCGHRKRESMAICSAEEPLWKWDASFYTMTWLLATVRAREASYAQDIPGAVNTGMLWEVPVGPQMLLSSLHTTLAQYRAVSAFISLRWAYWQEGRSTWWSLIFYAFHTAALISVGDVRSIPNMKISFKILRVYNHYFTYGRLFIWRWKKKTSRQFWPINTTNPSHYFKCFRHR